MSLLRNYSAFKCFTVWPDTDAWIVEEVSGNSISGTQSSAFENKVNIII